MQRFDYQEVVGFGNLVSNGLADSNVIQIDGEKYMGKTGLLEYIREASREGWEVSSSKRDGKYWFILLKILIE